MAQTLLLLYAITNEKTIKLTEINRIPATSCTSPQKHVPITLVGIPYLVSYTLSTTTISIITQKVLKINKFLDHAHHQQLILTLGKLHNPCPRFNSQTLSTKS